MRRFWRYLRSDDRGATSIEYGLLIAILGLSLLLSTPFVAEEVDDIWTLITSSVTGA